MKKLFKSTIFTQLLFYFFPIALLPLLVILSFTYFQAKKTLQTEKLTYLRTILTRHAEHIESYINERHGAVKTLSQMPSIMNALVEFHQVFQKGGTASPEYISIDRQLRPFMTTYKETYGYEDLFLISREGDVIFSVMHREDLGTNLQWGPYRKTELAGVFLKAVTLLETEISRFDYYPPAGKPAGFMAAPVFYQGRFAGVVALQMNMRELAKVVNDVTGLEKTGETVVAARVGHEAVFMAPSRFDPDAAFKRKVILDSPLAVPIQEAVNKKQGSGVSHDYRNREVLAAWKYLPSIRWGMVIKMDASEAFQPISAFRGLLIYVGIATFLLVIGVTLFAAKTFSRPIAKLQSMTRRIAAGELNEKIEIPARNEIGQLAESFNTMTAELNRYHHQMEELVAQRTEELKTVNELLRRESAFLQLQKDIAVAANENQPVEEVMRFSLRRVCQEMTWPVGHLYLVDETSWDRLIPTDVWYIGDPDRFDTFREITELTPFDPGVGLPGRVWASGHPAWIPDVTRDSNFPRAQLADDIGVRAGFAFPILVGNEVVGVMEFFSEKVLQPNSRLLEIFANIGTQMGRVVERQRSEKALKEINDHLEFRVRERTAKLENSNRRLKKEISDRKMAEEKLKTYAVELERSNQDLQDFASVASHDLQEPLRKIISFGDRLKSQIQGADPKTVDYLNRMQRSADRMVHFIRDLLQYSRLMTQAKPFEPTDLKQIIGEVLGDLEPRIIQTRGTVKVENLPTLKADPFQMRQLFQNLLGNALKYHKEEAPPLVRLHSRHAGNQMWEITVEDNGIGFDEKYVKRIFKPFERLHNNGTFEGTGMGLAICQKIVNRHHGKIVVRSQPTKGSSFIVLLPNK